MDRNGEITSLENAIAQFARYRDLDEVDTDCLDLLHERLVQLFAIPPSLVGEISNTRWGGGAQS